MNQPKWNQLRGYINLKTALALGAIALAGAFVIKLPAQDQQDCPTCGVKEDAKQDEVVVARYPDSLLQSGSFTAGSSVPEQNRGPRGVTLMAAQKNLAIDLGANLTGAFADLKTNTVVNETVTINKADDRSLIKGEFYHLSAAVVSVDSPIYGLTIGGTNQRSVGKEDNPNTLRVALSNPAHIIHIESDISAEDLLAPGESWKAEMKPVAPQSRKVAVKQVTANGARVHGTISGDFADLRDDADAKMPFVTKTLDIFRLDDAEVGFLGGGYEFTTTFAAPDAKSKIAFAALGGGNDAALPLLMADTDVPQDWLLVQGVITNQKYPDAGLGWVVRDQPYFEVPDALKNSLKKKIGFYRSPSSQEDTRFAFDTPGFGSSGAPQLPPLQQGSKPYVQSYAQEVPPTAAPQATPKPTATPIAVTPNDNGGSTISVQLTPSANGYRLAFTLTLKIPYVKIFGFEIGTKPKAVSSSLTFTNIGDRKVGVLYDATLDTCSAAIDVPNISAAVGLVVNPSTASYASEAEQSKAQKAFYANSAWKSQDNPKIPLLSVSQPFKSERTIAVGHKDVPFQWTQEVTAQGGELVVNYSNEKFAKVIVTALNYLPPLASFDIDKATACPIPVPTPTATPKTQDSPAPGGQTANPGGEAVPR